MLEKKTDIDLIEVLESGAVHVRSCIRTIENGIQINGTFHRHVIIPGADYSAEDAKVQAVCAKAHTADVITAYAAALSSQPNQENLNG